MAFKNKASTTATREISRNRCFNQKNKNKIFPKKAEKENLMAHFPDLSTREREPSFPRSKQFEMQSRGDEDLYALEKGKLKRKRDRNEREPERFSISFLDLRLPEKQKWQLRTRSPGGNRLWKPVWGFPRMDS